MYKYQSGQTAPTLLGHWSRYVCVHKASLSCKAIRFPARLVVYDTRIYCNGLSFFLVLAPFFALPVSGMLAEPLPVAAASSDFLLFFFCLTAALALSSGDPAAASPLRLLFPLLAVLPFCCDAAAGFDCSSGFMSSGVAASPAELSLAASVSPSAAGRSSGENEELCTPARLLRRTCSMSPLRRMSCVSVALYVCTEHTPTLGGEPEV